MKSKREAEDQIREAFAQVEEHEAARKKFARTIYQAHKARYLSDGEISRVIGQKLSRTRIQQIRKKVERDKADVN